MSGIANSVEAVAARRLKWLAELVVDISEPLLADTTAVFVLDRAACLTVTQVLESGLLNPRRVAVARRS